MKLRLVEKSGREVEIEGELMPSLGYLVFGAGKQIQISQGEKVPELEITFPPSWIMSKDEDTIIVELP